MKAVILAAGISSRMRPLTDHTPKPMLRIAGKPLIEWVVLSLRRGGITDILITTHYLSTVITDYLGDGVARPPFFRHPFSFSLVKLISKLPYERHIFVSVFVCI